MELRWSVSSLVVLGALSWRLGWWIGGLLPQRGAR
jgi:hypothetical protein